jgi:uncharacterized membrane protein YidH (DUF202 family)
VLWAPSPSMFRAIGSVSSAEMGPSARSISTFRRVVRHHDGFSNPGLLPRDERGYGSDLVIKQMRPVPPDISDGRRLAIHVALFVACFGIYAIFRSMWSTTVGADHVPEFHGSLLGSFALLLGLSAVAFGAASWFQPRWRSRDAGRVASIVWLAVSLGYMLVFGCPRVLLLVGIAFVPFCMGALIGHNVGRFHHPAHWDGIEMTFDD